MVRAEEHAAKGEAEKALAAYRAGFRALVFSDQDLFADGQTMTRSGLPEPNGGPLVVDASAFIHATMRTSPDAASWTTAGRRPCSFMNMGSPSRSSRASAIPRMIATPS